MTEHISASALAKIIAKENGIAEVEAMKCLKIFAESVTEAVAAGEVVQFRGFGTFYAVHMEREVMNPKTGERHGIANVSHPRFRASKAKVVIHEQ